MNPAPGLHIPEPVLYTIIGSLIAIIVTVISVFGGLWLRANDAHRQWATEQITEHAQTIAILKSDFGSIREDLAEIKMAMNEHFSHDRRLHTALVAKLGLEVEPD